MTDDNDYTAYQKREAIVKYADDHDVSLDEASDHFKALEFSDPDGAASLASKHPKAPK